MTAGQVMAELESLGTEQHRKVYARHGATGPLFGVSFVNLRGLAKRVGRQQELARELWASGNVDARLLACMVAEPESMTEAEMGAWLGDISYYVLVDEFVAGVAGKAPGVVARAARWMDSSSDWAGQAGWDLVAHLAMKDPSLEDGFFASLLERIEREIGAAQNRTRHAMNSALIAIGIRNATLEKLASAAAARIGKVVVDHGKTGCVTPDALSYIAKARERQAARLKPGAGAG